MPIAIQSYSCSEDIVKHEKGQGKILLPSNWQFQSSALLGVLDDLCEVDRAYINDNDNAAIDQTKQEEATIASITENM
eukprot:15261414-Ditylum_brightwellii.AAC.1